jgi:hypothetical protein
MGVFAVRAARAALVVEIAADIDAVIPLVVDVVALGLLQGVARVVWGEVALLVLSSRGVAGVGG